VLHFRGRRAGLTCKKKTMAGNTQWAIDPGHSELQFKIKHLAITNVTGKFRAFQGTVVCADGEFNEAVVHATIDAASLDTNHPQRDTHLRSPDFLAVEQYPTIGFDGRLEKTGEQYVLNGELQIRDVRRPIQLTAEFNGMATGRFGDTRAGFELRGKINRAAYGLTWNVLAEGGGLVVGDDINLIFDIQLARQ
jgi:polyisoprenoid-binding protein YceI